MPLSPANVLLLTLYSTPRYAPTPFSSRTASTLFSFLACSYTVTLWSHQRDRDMNLPVAQYSHSAVANNESVLAYYAMKLSTNDLSTFITYTDKLSSWLRSERAYYAAARPEVRSYPFRPFILVNLNELLNVDYTSPRGKIFSSTKTVYNAANLTSDRSLEPVWSNRC